ncbi:GNAT family N-acetyltransferase [Anabaena azotica]|uniref:GNAT family N-acetyltransferase n=1 Tax=Anabaena azotica TaxID=197653 RepID=UPI0039A67E6B
MDKKYKNNSIKIESINAESSYLSDVIDLWKPHRSTLGLFPKDAFIERAAKRQILIAIDSESECIGYLLYRNSYDRITIVHLCISPSYRKQGIPDLLVNELKKVTVEKYRGIGLSCRHDYGLQSMWSRLGFVYKYDKPGKNKAGKLLGFWWLDHGHNNLLSSLPIQKLESKLCVIIDRSIYLNLYKDEYQENDHAKLLLSDWLEPELELCITDEIFNYISLISDDQERKLQTELAQRFTSLPCLNQNLETVKENLQKFLLSKGVFIEDIDLRHLARAIASDSHVFISKEDNLLGIADEVYENFKLSILTPHELINQLDELRNKPDYQPVRLAGSSLKKVRVQRGQEKLLTQYFVSDSRTETTSAFRQYLRRFISDTDKFESYVVLNKEQLPIALFVYGKTKNNELEIPLLRVSKNPLAATLARHIIFKSILLSANEGRQFTRITDPYLEETVINAIQDDNFIRVNNGWFKINLAVAETASDLSKHLNNLGYSLTQEYDFCLKIAESLNSELLLNDVKASADFEKFLFPAKIIDSQINNFIIPIQPRWAQDLFDEDLAQQTLLPLLELEPKKIGLSFNREAVYYKTVTHRKLLNSPGRILWYVSQDKSYCGVSSIKACSFIDEVLIGKPKELYQRFQRLGVYKLDDIINISPDKNGDIMAIRFSNTELLKYPIPLQKVQEVLDNKTTLPSPFKIQNSHFLKFYNLGCIKKLKN